MSGKMKNGKKASRLVNLTQCYNTFKALTRNDQAQISRLARKSDSSTSTERESSTHDKPSPVKSRLAREDANRRYAILDQDDSLNEVRRKFPTSPYVVDSRLAVLFMFTYTAFSSPKVISSKALPQKECLLPDFKMYDAIPAPSMPTSPPMDSEMEKFLPMLNDYLNCRCLKLNTEPPLD